MRLSNYRVKGWAQERAARLMDALGRSEMKWWWRPRLRPAFLQQAALLLVEPLGGSQSAVDPPASANQQRWLRLLPYSYHHPRDDYGPSRWVDVSVDGRRLAPCCALHVVFLFTVIFLVELLFDFVVFVTVVQCSIVIFDNRQSICIYVPN